MEVDFPRGGGSSVQPSYVKNHQSSGIDKKGSDKKSNEKSKSKSKKRSAPDFLFGKDEDTPRQKKGLGDTKKRQKYSKNENNDVNMDDDLPLVAREDLDATLEATRLSKAAAARTLMPLGGGAVVSPDNNNSKRQVNHKKKYNTNTVTAEPYILPLTLTRIKPGLKVLAYVRQILNDVILFSLPSQWTGYLVRKQNQDASFTSQLQVGQLLAVVVTHISEEEGSDKIKKRRIHVDADPGKINNLREAVQSSTPGYTLRGRVMSIEDHGLLVDLGFKRRGFVSFAHVGSNGIGTDNNNNNNEYVITESAGSFLASSESSTGVNNSNTETVGSHDDDGENMQVDNDNNDTTNNNNITQNNVVDNRDTPLSKSRRTVGVWPGRLLDFIVHESVTSNSTIIPLMLLNHDERAKHLTRLDSSNNNNNNTTKKPSFPQTGFWKLDSLQPGFLVECIVESTAINGLCVRMGDKFRGSIEWTHLGDVVINSVSGTSNDISNNNNDHGSNDKKIKHKKKGNNNNSNNNAEDVVSSNQKTSKDSWKKSFPENETLMARVLIVDPVHKMVRLTVLPHLMSLDNGNEVKARNKLLVGHIYDYAMVVNIDKKNGMYLALSSSRLTENTSSSVDVSTLVTHSNANALNKDSNNDNHKDVDNKMKGSANWTDEGEKVAKNDDTSNDLDGSTTNSSEQSGIVEDESMDDENVETDHDDEEEDNKDDDVKEEIYEKKDNDEDDEDDDNSFDHNPEPSLHRNHSSTNANKNHDDDQNHQLVFVHASKAVDEQSEDFHKHFKVGSNCSVRILSHYSMIDGIASGGIAQSILKAFIMTYHDLKPGLLSNATICRDLGKERGILVDFGMEVRGLIPEIHLFDTVSNSKFRKQLRNELYTVGKNVDVRVLFVDAGKGQCLLTAKKSMLKTEHVISDYASAKPGQKGAGFIQSIDKLGMTICFFNGVHGRVTAKSLKLELGIENHQEHYKIGDAVSCRVLVNKAIQNTKHGEDEVPRIIYELTLSLKEQSDTELSKTLGNIDENKILDLGSGKILPVKSIKIVDLKDGKQKKEGHTPGYALVSIKTKYFTENEAVQEYLPQIECKLSYEQLLDSYEDSTISSAKSLNRLAKQLLTVGKKVNRKGFIMVDCKKSLIDHKCGIGPLAMVSIRPKMVEVLEVQHDKTDLIKKNKGAIVPSEETELSTGSNLVGYVFNIHEKHGTFVKFLDMFTGLVPKNSGGLLLPLYSTVQVKVTAIENASSDKRITLAPVMKSRLKELQSNDTGVQVGDIIERVEVTEVKPRMLALRVLDKRLRKSKIVARMKYKATNGFDDDFDSDGEADIRSINHTLRLKNVKVGDVLQNLTVVAVKKREKSSLSIVELAEKHDSKRDISNDGELVDKHMELSEGDKLTVKVSRITKHNSGIVVVLEGGTNAYIPGLEVSEDVEVLNNLQVHYKADTVLECRVISNPTYSESNKNSHTEQSRSDRIYLSLLAESKTEISCGNVVVGRINRKSNIYHPPALMLDTRSGGRGRCCITELCDVKEWTNMPLNDNSDFEDSSSIYNHGRYVRCRVLRKHDSGLLEVSLRESRIKRANDENNVPKAGDIVQGYVTATNKHGCFVRFATNVIGRASKKEVSDKFDPNIETRFPPGRLILAKIKSIASVSDKSSDNDQQEYRADIDLRASVINEKARRDEFDKVQIGKSYSGTVTKVMNYGVFVRLNKYDTSGLVAMKEVSDNFVSDITELYERGDLVKVKVLRKDDEKKHLVLSMRASRFVGEPDSEDEDDDDNSSESDEQSLGNLDDDNSDIDSDDENFVAKLQAKMARIENDDKKYDMDEMSVESQELVTQRNKDPKSSGNDEEESDDDDDESSNDDDNAGDNDDSDVEKEKSDTMETDVGFVWSVNTSKQADHQDEVDSADDVESDSDDENDDENENTTPGSSHKSRQRQAARRREEQEISRRERALADGTADERPETASDFERLLASHPNSSETWIRYMAFHLALADISAARKVANRAFERIEFREEAEKLNVWCALLTLELKYGDESSFEATMTRACQQNNPKKIYLRVCEILQKEATTSLSKDSIRRADDMFAKMCKKFRDKKIVWLAYAQYLLESGRNEEAHDVMKKALLSLPKYKHVESMSKFAQLLFAHDCADTAKTVFDSLLSHNPKRLDILFVYIDQHVKHDSNSGSINGARQLLERIVSRKDETLKMKLSDKQMKSLFKKWYALEEQYGNDETREHVKDAARAYVEQNA